MLLGCGDGLVQFEDGGGGPAQGGQAPKDEYKLSTDSKKDKAKSIAVAFWPLTSRRRSRI